MENLSENPKGKEENTAGVSSPVIQRIHYLSSPIIQRIVNLLENEAKYPQMLYFPTSYVKSSMFYEYVRQISKQYSFSEDDVEEALLSIYKGKYSEMDKEDFAYCMALKNAERNDYQDEEIPLTYCVEYAYELYAKYMAMKEKGQIKDKQDDIENITSHVARLSLLAKEVTFPNTQLYDDFIDDIQEELIFNIQQDLKIEDNNLVYEIVEELMNEAKITLDSEERDKNCKKYPDGTISCEFTLLYGLTIEFTNIEQLNERLRKEGYEYDLMQAINSINRWDYDDISYEGNYNEVYATVWLDYQFAY